MLRSCPVGAVFFAEFVGVLVDFWACCGAVELGVVEGGVDRGDGANGSDCEDGGAFVLLETSEEDGRELSVSGKVVSVEDESTDSGREDEGG